MTGNSARNARIASQMQRALAPLLRRDVKDPRVGNVTVTAVTVASDLSTATIFVLPFADRGSDAAAMLAGLNSAAGYLRGQLARELKLRHAPRLQFRLDDQLEHAHHLTSLIDQAVATDHARTDHAGADHPQGESEPGARRPSEE